MVWLLSPRRYPPRFAILVAAVCIACRAQICPPGYLGQNARDCIPISRAYVSFQPQVFGTQSHLSPSFNVAIPPGRANGESIPVPPGFDAADSGEAFSEKPSGLRYGWNADITDGVRLRGCGAPHFGTNPEFVTMIIPDRGAALPETSWRIEVPSGVWTVEMAFDDCEFGGTISDLTIQGIPVPNFLPSHGQFDVFTYTRAVVDHTFTFQGDWPAVAIVSWVGLARATSCADAIAANGGVDPCTQQNAEHVCVDNTADSVAMCEPACPLTFSSEWLETLYEPVLDTDSSGFLQYGRPKDTISIVFDNPDGFQFVTASIGSGSETIEHHGDPPQDVSASSPDGPYTNSRRCYTRYEVHSTWGDVRPSCSSAVNGNFLEFTCKLSVENMEYLDPIRQQTLTRTIISNIPFVVRFPRQVSATVTGLSAFRPPDVLAAIVRQEVIVNVGDLLDLTAQIKLYTSVQWPFRLHDETVLSTPADIQANSFVLETQCADPNAGDLPNPTVLDANACGQIWLLDLDVANGAQGPPCELDGQYSVQFSAQCQPSWPSDCPLVQDDQGVLDNLFTVDFTIDSEYFCPRVVDEVDVAASLAVYKDLAHNIPASNFILGQTAYFVASVSSSKVTVVKAEVNTISVQPDGAAGSSLVYNVAGGSACDAADAGDLGVVNSLVVLDGPCESGQDAEAWFQFLVDLTSVPDVPGDGSRDFSVSVTLDVTFKNAGSLLEEKKQVVLLQQETIVGPQGFRSNSQQSSATSQFGVQQGSGDDSTSAAAGTAGACIVGLVAVLLASFGVGSL